MRIFIEDLRADITRDLSNQITYAVDDLQNIDSKATTVSKTIIFPGTANNNNLFGNIFDVNNSNFTNDNLPNVKYNFNAAKSAKVRIEMDGLVIAKGTLRMMEIIVDGSNVEYECFLIGELGGFVMKMAARRLQDLDFSEYNHLWLGSQIDEDGLPIPGTSMEDRWLLLGSGTGYYYPLIDYGTTYNSGGLKHSWYNQSLRPAFFVYEYLQKIFAQAGYTWDCDLFETDRFKRLIIPHNKKDMFSIFDYNLQMIGNTGHYELVSDYFPQHPSLLMYFGDVVSNVDFTRDIFNPIYEGIPSLSGTLYFTITGTYEKTAPQHFKVKLLKNGSSIFDFEIDDASTSGGFTHTFTVADTLVTDDDFKLSLLSTQYIDPAIIVDISSIELRFGTGIPVTDLTVEGAMVYVNQTCLPNNILQKDFFTSILKLFNLYVVEERYMEKHLVIKPWSEFYTGEVEDWSSKVDRSKVLRLKPMSELNSRFYEFSYKDDSDYYNDLYKKRYNQTYGARLFDSRFEFANETSKCELIFSPTPLVGYADEDKIYSTILKRTGEGADIKEDRMDSNIRILQAKLIDPVDSWMRATDGGSGIQTYTVFPYAGHLDDPYTPTNDLNFGATKELFFSLTAGTLSVNQFNVYYSPYMAEITDKDSRLLTCYVKLSDVDIFNLDFRIYKWIDGCMYRLIRVIDYVPGSNDAVKVELLRVIYTNY